MKDGRAYVWVTLPPPNMTGCGQQRRPTSIKKDPSSGPRALGRGPLAQYGWIYEHPVDLDAVRRFHHNLGHGLLGRRVERSPLPFARDRWVTWRGPADIDLVGHRPARVPR